MPSPTGFFQVTVDSVDIWWRDVALADVAEAARMKTWDATDKELRRFMHVAAVVLSKRGLLDENNQPTERALHETKHACRAWAMTPGVRIKVSWRWRRPVRAGHPRSSSLPC